MIKYESIYSLGNYPGAVLGDYQRFRRVDREGFNSTDTPDKRFFKILFYFYNDDPGDTTDINFFNGGSSGLLAPTWLDNPRNDEYYKYNSAWSFLKSNFEEERADALQNFIYLLSQISSESPWYFQTISGVDEALMRENWKVEDARKKITIECLPDPVDHRIETLLSLYRSIVWSHTRKCEILPANLRKFDMGLFLFSGAINGLIVQKNMEGHQTNWAKMGTFAEQSDRALYKYIEFHNCEINIDSIKSGFGSMSNAEGIENKFNIEIYFDDCYEHEFNPFIMRQFGDFFIWDAWTTSSFGEDGNTLNDTPDFSGNEMSWQAVLKQKESVLQTDMDQRLNYFDYTQNQINQISSNFVDKAKSSVINMITGGLGNIYGKGGGIAGVTDAVEQEASQQLKSLSTKIIGNINDSATKISKSAAAMVTEPVVGSIKATGTMVGDLVDSATNVIAKPVLGTLKTGEVASKRATELGTGYINDAGEYIDNESKKLGDIAYDSQVALANQIGKNRLNNKLGKL